MELKLHEVKVRKALARKRSQEKLIKIILTIVVAISLIFAAVVVTQAASKKYQTIIVKRGDTVWNIANSLSDGKNVRSLVNEISNVNGINPDQVVTGQEIVVPVY